jgi:hypothetical protein
MRVKVYEHGQDHYQLARLDNDGKVKSVRPATVEEFRLYVMLNDERALRRETQQKLQATEEQAERFEKQAEDYARACQTRDIFSDQVKASHRKQDELADEIDRLNAGLQTAREELSQMRIRAEAAEQALVEGR